MGRGGGSHGGGGHSGGRSFGGRGGGFGGSPGRGRGPGFGGPPPGRARMGRGPAEDGADLYFPEAVLAGRVREGEEDSAARQQLLSSSLSLLLFPFS